jgi:tetratricopeptide (TPR) repeat protein
MQDELTQRIVATVAPELNYSQPPVMRTATPQNLDAWGLVQRGYGHVFNLDLESIKLARGYFEEAISHEAGYSRAYTGLAFSYHREFWLDRLKFVGDAKERFIEAARRAVSLDDLDAEAHIVLSMACNWFRENDRSLLEAKRAVDLNPNNAHAHQILGTALTLVGRATEGLTSQQRALLLSPRDPRHGIWMWFLGLTYLAEHNYEDAVQWSERAIQRYPSNPDAHLVLASGLGHLGRIADARVALKGYRELVPNQPEQPDLVWPFKRESDNEHFRDGIYKGGWNPWPPSGKLEHVPVRLIQIRHPEARASWRASKDERPGTRRLRPRGIGGGRRPSRLAHSPRRRAWGLREVEWVI